MAERGLDKGGVFGMSNVVTGATKDPGFGCFGYFTPTQEPPESIQSRFNAVLRVSPQAPVGRNFVVQ